MSAKRRQEAIARFSVPLEGMRSSEKIESSAPRRPSRKPRDARLVGSSSDGDSWDENDSDFVVCDDAELDYGLSSKRGKTKGKGKAVLDENPRVMLLSLKAVC